MAGGGRTLLPSPGPCLDRGGGTRDRSNDMGAPLRGHGRVTGRSPGSAVAAHSRKARPCTSPRNSSSTTASSNAASPSTASGSPVDARGRVRFHAGPADPAGPPAARSGRDVSPSGVPRPARGGGRLRLGHDRTAGQRRPPGPAGPGPGARGPPPRDAGGRTGRRRPRGRPRPPLVDAAAPEWRAAIDTLLQLPEVTGPVGVSGGLISLGVRLTATDPRIAAAVLFAGSFVPRVIFEEARRVTVPLHVLLQWDDEGNDRESSLALFDAFASGTSPSTPTWAATQASRPPRGGGGGLFQATSEEGVIPRPAR